MRDVAQAAGVSKALVSIVFRGAPGASEESRRHIFEVADKIGYRSNRWASMLALTRTHQLGIVHELHNGFHSELVEAAFAASLTAGYRAILSPRTDTFDEEQAITTALEFRCEALILLGTTLHEDKLHELAQSVPIVCVGLPVSHPTVDSAASNDVQGMGAVLDHLLALGHREIVHIDGGDSELSMRRRDGFLTAASDRGLNGLVRVVDGGPTELEGNRAARELLHGRRSPSAIVAFNDVIALGAMDAALSEGLTIPEDISISGYDDSPLARTAAINLTSVSQGAGRLGEWAAQAAINRLDGNRDRTQRLSLEPELRIRRSTGPARI